MRLFVARAQFLPHFKPNLNLNAVGAGSNRIASKMNDAAKSYKAFDARLKGIAKRKTRLERGYKSQVSRDGLIILRPQKRAISPRVSFRGLFYLVFGFFLFKGMIMAHLGGTIYAERVTALQEGTFIEQAGGFVMQPDRVTQAIATQLRPFLKR